MTHLVQCAPVKVGTCTDDAWIRTTGTGLSKKASTVTGVTHTGDEFMHLQGVRHMQGVVLRLSVQRAGSAAWHRSSQAAQHTPHTLCLRSLQLPLVTAVRRRRERARPPVVRSAWRCSVACVASSAANTSLPRAYSCSRWKASSKAPASTSLTLRDARADRRDHTPFRRGNQAWQARPRHRNSAAVTVQLSLPCVLTGGRPPVTSLGGAKAVSTHSRLRTAVVCIHISAAPSSDTSRTRCRRP